MLDVLTTTCYSFKICKSQNFIERGIKNFGISNITQWNIMTI